MCSQPPSGAHDYLSEVWCRAQSHFCWSHASQPWGPLAAASYCCGYVSPHSGGLSGHPYDWRRLSGVWCHLLRDGVGIGSDLSCQPSRHVEAGAVVRVEYLVWASLTTEILSHSNRSSHRTTTPLLLPLEARDLHKFASIHFRVHLVNRVAAGCYHHPRAPNQSRLLNFLFDVISDLWAHLQISLPQL